MEEGVDYTINIRLWDGTTYVASCLLCEYRTGRYPSPKQALRPFGEHHASKHPTQTCDAPSPVPVEVPKSPGLDPTIPTTGDGE